MMGILVLMAVASLGMGLAKLVRVPFIPVLMLLGILISPDYLQLDRTFLQDALLLGLAFLVFATGTNMSPSRVGIQGKAALRIGFIQLGVTAALGFGLSLVSGFSSVESFYIAFGIAASSTLVVIRLLQQRRQQFEPFGRMLVGVLLLQDIVIILIAATVAHIDMGLLAALRGLLTMGVLTLATLAFSKLMVPRLLLSGHMDEEYQFLIALGILFLFLGVSTVLEVHLIAAAFLAGVSLSSFPVSGILRGQLASLVDFFTAIFFVTLGLFVELPSLEIILSAFGFVLVIILLTPALVAVTAYFGGLTLRSAVEGGLLLALASEFSIVLAMIGLQQGHIDGNLFAMLVLISVITMIMNPFIASDEVALWLSKMIGKLIRTETAARKPLQGHIVLLGCGESGIKILQQLKGVDLPVIAVDQDAAVVKHIQELGFDGIVADGGNPEHLKMLALDKAKLVISTMTKASDHKTAMRAAGSTPILIRVFDEGEADLLGAGKTAAIPVSRAAAEEFCDWLTDLGYLNRPTV